MGLGVHYEYMPLIDVLGIWSSNVGDSRKKEIPYKKGIAEDIIGP